jgi:hypothetical protein
MSYVKIYVLYCLDEVEQQLPLLNDYYERVDLRNIWRVTGHQGHGDGDFFRSDIQIDTPYVGVISGRFNTKHPLHETRLEELYSLPFEENVVWAPYYMVDNWYTQAIQNHVGMNKYLDELIGTHKEIKLRGSFVFAQSFIASAAVFKDWQKFWISWFNKWNKEKPLDYYHYPQHASQWSGALMERVTIAYFSMRDDLTIKQIP